MSCEAKANFQHVHFPDKFTKLALKRLRGVNLFSTVLRCVRHCKTRLRYLKLSRAQGQCTDPCLSHPAKMKDSKQILCLRCYHHSKASYYRWEREWCTIFQSHDKGLFTPNLLLTRAPRSFISFDPRIVWSFSTQTKTFCVLNFVTKSEKINNEQKTEDEEGKGG